MDILFISDLHLTPERPDKIELFRRLMRGPARSAAALYLLGDLFEQFWVGIDDATPPAAEVMEEIRVLASSGVPVFLQRGNRDLLIDRRLEDLCGARVLPDESVVEIGGSRALVMHGDLLCTRDRSYQWFRKFMDARAVRGLFESLPCSWRAGLAHGLRPMFRKSAAGKAPEIVDVDQAEVERRMRGHGVTELIHGHTHRPARHSFELDGRAALRHVLGDWYGEPLMLACRGSERNLVRVRDYLEKN